MAQPTSSCGTFQHSSNQPTTTEKNPVRSFAESRWLRFVETHNSRLEHKNHGIEKVEIKLAGYTGVVKVDKNKLMQKSDFFRAMLSSSFQVSLGLERFVPSG